MEIKGKVAVVSGGASGLGLACARRLAAQGALVAVIDADLDALAALESTDIKGWKCDVSDAPQIEQAFEAIREQMGSVSILFNCAGIARPGAIVRRGKPMPLDEFRQVIAVNLLGSINTIRCAAAQMMQASEADPCKGGEHGVIINTSSIAATEGQVGQAAYAASKGGVASMTLPLARELGPYGIRINAVSPGIFATPMTLSLPEKSRNVVFAAIPPYPPRPGQPSEFADLMTYIVTQPMLNGAVVRLDGGLRMPALY